MPSVALAVQIVGAMSLVLSTYSVVQQGYAHAWQVLWVIDVTNASQDLLDFQRKLAQVSGYKNKFRV